MITQEQAADLQPGDVVELSLSRGPANYFRMNGMVVGHGNGELSIGGEKVIRWGDGRRPSWTADYSLTVVSRAPRPLYVNHPRTEPVPGDVARDADSDDASTWMADADGTWLTIPGAWVPGNGMPARLRLLVDGDTGQVVL